MDISDPRIDTTRSWRLSDPPPGPLPPHTAWRRADLAERDWLVPIPPECLREIDAVVRELRADPIPTLVLTQADYDLAHCRMLMARVKAALDDGPGFVVLDRLPVDAYDKAELATVYWLLSQMIARPVAQSFGGTLLYDVHDTGRKTDVRVRADVTNEDLSWHTDYGFNNPPPYIGLLVLRTAKAGGESAVASLHTGHDVLRARNPGLLRRLYEPFVWNRQGEHPDDAPVCTWNPVFAAAGNAVRARFNRRLQPAGYMLLGQQIDELGCEALDTLHDVLSEPEQTLAFRLEAGQLEFLNNARVAHCRTAFEDHAEPDRKRHWLRIFLRDEGRRSYMG